MIQDLSPPELEHATLEETLRWLADLFKSRFAFTVSYRIAVRSELSREQLRLVYRCVRELLMNACKHSRRHNAVRTAGGALAIDSLVGEGCRATIRIPAAERGRG